METAPKDSEISGNVSAPLVKTPRVGQTSEGGDTTPVRVSPNPERGRYAGIWGKSVSLVVGVVRMARMALSLARGVF